MTINLHYIRAAIRQKTGKDLSLREVRKLLLEEKLITEKQAREDAKIFEGYYAFYSPEIDRRFNSYTSEYPQDIKDEVSDILKQQEHSR